MSWTDDAKRISIVQVAGELHLEVRGRRLAICPAGCKGDAVRLFARPDGERFHCHRCAATGDTIDLAATVLTGGRLPRGGGEPARQVRGWFAARGWCEADAWAPPVERREVPKVEPKQHVGLVRELPPRDLVARVLRDTRRGGDTPGVAAWVRRRVGDEAAARILRRDIVRALGDGPLPHWCSFHRTDWRALGYHAVFPLFDHLGEARSLRVRCIGEAPQGAPKSLPPAGFGVGGLVMADPLGQLLLRTGARPEWWPQDRVLRLTIAEGEPQFLAWAAARDGDGGVFGIFAGSWTQDFADRFPTGCEVTVCTDFDKPGDAYFQRVFTTMSSRHTVLRWRPPHVSGAVRVAS